MWVPDPRLVGGCAGPHPLGKGDRAVPQESPIGSGFLAPVRGRESTPLLMWEGRCMIPPSMLALNLV